MTDADFKRYEDRAHNAISGYSADVNITCYVYGADVLALLKEIKELKLANELLKSSVDQKRVTK